MINFRIMRKLPFVFLLTLAAFAQTPEPPKFRLPDTASPVRYGIDLTVIPGSSTFTGTAAIDLAVKQATSVLWLSASDLTIESASLRVANADRLAKVVPGGSNFAGLAFDPPLAPGNATLRIAYAGKIQRGSSAGVFQMPDGKNPAFYVFTQFEPTDARRAFPCFDEPQFKTPWQLTLHVKKTDLAAANTPIVSEADEAGGMKRVEFAPTRPLPSYLIAFAVGPFEVVDAGQGGRKKIPLRILVPIGRSEEAAFSRTAIPELLHLLEEYFDSPYPYDKLDSVSMPIANFAMENVGLITYAQGMLLSKPEAATTPWKTNSATVIAHEMAHQWFGDLVTTKWWDDIWLNEAFATWMETKITGQWKPEWKMEVSEVMDSLGAMGLDSLATTRRIRQPILGEDDIANAFDGITYQKGAAVIGMFEKWLGEKPFQNGVRRYMKAYADQAATTDQFLTEIDMGVGRDVSAAFNSFLNQPGVPLVTAELRCGNGAPRLELSQRRSLPIGSKANTGQHWMIPLCTKYSVDGAIQRECAVFSEPSAEMKLTHAKSCPAWVMANDEESGYYRVLYSSDLLEKLLADHGSHLDLAEKVGVLGDIGALVRSGDLPAVRAVTLVEPFTGDSDYRIVGQTVGIAASAFSSAPDGLRPAIGRFYEKVYGERARELGWIAKPDESDDLQSLRGQLVSVVATVGKDEQLVKEAKTLALRWLDDHSTLKPRIAGLVLAVGVRDGDQALFDRIHAAALKTQDRRERAQLINAMASFENPEIIRQRMNLVLSGEFDMRESFGPFLFRAPEESRKMPFEFVKQNLDALLKKLPREVGADFAADLPRVGGGFCSAADRAELEAFFKPKVEQYTGGPRNLAQTLEGIDLCIARRQAAGPDLAEFLKKY
jgi:alanyl aminopeptidase